MTPFTIDNFLAFKREVQFRLFFYLDLDSLQVETIVTFSYVNQVVNVKSYTYVIDNNTIVDAFTGNIATDSTPENNKIGYYDYFLSEMGNYSTPLSFNMIGKLKAFVISKQNEFIL